MRGILQGKKYRLFPVRLSSLRLQVRFPTE
uniref:Uncharacterized protein n=1 Tax=Myoviridae sp. ctrMq22 TaxID=2825181 RepID=A0A8S5NUU2_9CAUD|nr:MAG TPA: hypothetical protein [Myoviridae sp. ctrMq22]